MAAHNQLKQSESGFASPFQDHAFRPQPSYEFDEAVHHGETNMTSTNHFDAGHMDFDLVDDIYDGSIEHNMFVGPDGNVHMEPNMFAQTHSTANANQVDSWQNSNPTSQFNQGLQGDAQPPPKSAQSDIVNNRKDHVRERLGQLTPPDEGARKHVLAPSLDAQRAEEEDIAKENRTQRARNAANKRHSKSKAAKMDTPDDEDGSEDGESGQSQGKNTAVQREKNRVAAAKCRAKKKANSEEMQESHRDNSRQNAYLQREVRELRDQKAFLRNSLLQHEPGMCPCHAIHRFNMAQAQQLAFGVGQMGGQPLSPSQESAVSLPTPVSDISMDRAYQLSGSGGSSRKMSIGSGMQSSNNPRMYAFGQITSPNPTSSATATANDGSQVPQQFSEFLHSSNDRRAGFS